MRNTNTIFRTGLTTLTLAIFAAAPAWAQCGSSSKSAKSTKYASSKPDIVDTAVSAGQFNTLVAAVKAADLVDALKSDGPFTVFAPTDEAFAKLPKGTLETLLKPENKGKLQAILKYHVIAGKVPAGKVTTTPGAESLNGQWLSFAKQGSTVTVDGAKVVKADIKTRNGIIHVIDTVVLPTDKNIVETAKTAGAFNTLLTAAIEAGLADTLSNGGPFTVFAPTDEAFAKLPDGTIESLLKPENRDQLASILKYHVVSGRVYSPEAVKAGKAETLLGKELVISIKGGQARVNDARIISTDVDATNGVIHVIDSVILPS